MLLNINECILKYDYLNRLESQPYINLANLECEYINIIESYLTTHEHELYIVPPIDLFERIDFNIAVDKNLKQFIGNQSFREVKDFNQKVRLDYYDVIIHAFESKYSKYSYVNKTLELFNNDKYHIYFGQSTYCVYTYDGRCTGAIEISNNSNMYQSLVEIERNIKRNTNESDADMVLSYILTNKVLADDYGITAGPYDKYTCEQEGDILEIYNNSNAKICTIDINRDKVLQSIKDKKDLYEDSLYNFILKQIFKCNEEIPF